jgi:hypothetical protein
VKKVVRKMKIHRVQLRGSEFVYLADGTMFNSPGGLYDAARHLIAEGAHPKDRLEAWRGDMLCLSSTVEGFAVKGWGGKTKDPYPVKWEPSPWTVLPPRLAEWWQGRQG